MNRVGRGSTPRILAWAFYDFANSSFAAIVVTFVFATYFTKGIVGDEIRGTGLWSWAVTASSLIVALVSPALGAIADRSGHRRRWLIASTVLAVWGTVMLARAEPGMIRYAWVWFVLANIGFELGIVFCNAYLPALAPANRVGRISGYAWGLGYVGGVLSLAVALAGFILPDEPWFGVTKDGTAHIRATVLLTAIWFAVFSLPALVMLRDPPRASPRGGLADAYRQLVHTFHEVRRYREIAKLLLARLIYNDGLVTAFAFGGIYAQGTFGFDLNEIMIFGLVLNVSAGVGAFLLASVDDRIGGKRTIQLSLAGLVVAALLAVFSPNKAWFWFSGVLVGLFVGPNQAASRSLMARFVPAEQENEFFGFYAFSGKATAFLGPWLLGVLTLQFGSQRVGMAVVLAFFLIGAALLHTVDEAAGIRAREAG